MKINGISFLPELSFKTSRSSGKGGQHVNKVESRVELNFNVLESQLLTEEQKQLILERLHNRIDKEGVLQITVQKERSQYLNKAAAIEKFYELLEKALKKKKKRKPTKISEAAKQKRLKEKKELSEKKQSRRSDRFL